MRIGSKLVPGVVLRPVVCVVFSVLMMAAVAVGDAAAGKRKSAGIMPRRTFYDPPERGFEREIRKRLDYWAKRRKPRD